MTLNINNSEIIGFTNKLEKMHRKHLPLAVRKTLNNLALDGVKKKSLLNVSSSKFTQRNRNFFKVFSRVQFAQGFDISKMQSVVGMDTSKLASSNYAVKDLEPQELGGKIKGKSFIPLKRARVSNSWNRVPKKKYRIKNVQQNLVDSKENRKGRSDKQKFVLSSLYAGEGGFVIGTRVTSSGSRIIFEIRKISKRKTGYKIRTNPVYSIKSNRSVSVKRTNFMRESALIASKNTNSVFIKMAKNELARKS